MANHARHSTTMSPVETKKQQGGRQKLLTRQQKIKSKTRNLLE